jgi:ATP-dependent protease ClpP protease subunit
VDQREIFLWGEINEESAFKFVQEIRELGLIAQPIRVFIHSDGGELEAMSSIIDELDATRENCEVFLIAHGKAYSAAAFILGSSPTGYAWATPNSMIMLHPVSYDLPTDYKDVQDAASKFINRMFDKYLKIVADRIKKRKTTLEKQIKDGLWLTAMEALNLGLIDGIWTSDKSQV